uniref:Uncharacterized protein n=1 Tax=Arundo donax TaxID=35708 RepID=A0A0A9BLQ8_ARUDO
MPCQIWIRAVPKSLFLCVKNPLNTHANSKHLSVQLHITRQLHINLWV